MSEAKKPRRVRAPEKEPVTKGDFTKAAGRKQAKVDAIVANYEKAKLTAEKRLNKKYAQKLSEELSGTRTEIIAMLDLPDFVTLPDDSEVTEEEAAE